VLVEIVATDTDVDEDDKTDEADAIAQGVARGTRCSGSGIEGEKRGGPRCDTATLAAAGVPFRYAGDNLTR